MNTEKAVYYYEDIQKCREQIETIKLMPQHKKEHFAIQWAMQVSRQGDRGALKNTLRVIHNAGYTPKDVRIAMSK